MRPPALRNHQLAELLRPAAIRDPRAVRDRQLQQVIRTPSCANSVAAKIGKRVAKRIRPSVFPQGLSTSRRRKTSQRMPSLIEVLDEDHHVALLVVDYFVHRLARNQHPEAAGPQILRVPNLHVSRRVVRRIADGGVLEI